LTHFFLKKILQITILRIYLSNPSLHIYLSIMSWLTKFIKKYTTKYSKAKFPTPLITKLENFK